MGFIHKVIAREEVAVAFHGRDIAARLSKNAKRMFRPLQAPRRLFEDLHRDAADILPGPFFKDGAEESPNASAGVEKGAGAESDPGNRSTIGRNPM
jgi:hypothetical protein